MSKAGTVFQKDNTKVIITKYLSNTSSGWYYYIEQSFDKTYVSLGSGFIEGHPNLTSLSNSAIIKIVINHHCKYLKSLI